MERKYKLKALTIWPEWAWAIRWLGKDVENRTWHPPKSIIGKRIALHAGKGVGRRFAPNVKGALPYYDVMANVAKKAGFSFEMISGDTSGLRKMPYVGIAWFADRDIVVNGVEYSKSDLVKEMYFDSVLTSVIFATARIESTSVYGRFSGEKRSPWAAYGQFTWVLNDLNILRNPVPCAGKQRVWTIPKDFQIDVRVMDKYDMGVKRVS